jgi:cell division protein FtsW (lipid II flippase)
MEASMPSTDTHSIHRKQAVWSAIAGILFLVVAIFGRSWDWRGVLSVVTGVLWLLVSVQQFRKAQLR